MGEIDSEGFEWSTSSGETPPNVRARRKREEKEAKKKGKGKDKADDETAGAEEAVSPRRKKSTAAADDSWFGFVGGGGGGGDVDDLESMSSVDSDVDLRLRETPAQRRAKRLELMTRKPLKPLAPYTARFAYAGLGLTLFSFVMCAGAEATKNSLEKSASGKSTPAVLFSTLALVWGTVGSVASGAAGQSCPCIDFSPRMPEVATLRRSTMFIGWFLCFLALIVNIVALVTERALTKACRPGMHGAAGGLWALSGMALFVSHHVYRNALEEHAPVGGLVNVRSQEEQELAGSAVPGGDDEYYSEYEEEEEQIVSGRRGATGNALAGKGKGKGRRGAVV